AQGRGLGAQLVAKGLERAGQRGHRAVILVGDPDYYGRFGFERALTLGLSLPGPVEARRFLGLELEPGALRATEGAVRPSGRRAAAVFTRKPKKATRLAA
ncbi:MAG: GNAT family N-acetyltransferase, partial [Pseudomonadota bacterium]|nr:GNAT family N-acetyltransferase [Pseudomonadota bacterium]